MNEITKQSNQLAHKVIEDLNNSKIDKDTFNALTKAIKNNIYFDDEACDCEECEECDDCEDMIPENEISDYMTFSDVIEYVRYNSTSSEKEELHQEIEDYSYDDTISEIEKVNGLIDMEFKTLDDVMRMELLLKLYNSTYTLKELEGLITEEGKNKI